MKLPRKVKDWEINQKAVAMKSKSENSVITLEELHKIVPRRWRKYISQTTVDRIYQKSEETKLDEVLRDSFVTYIGVLNSQEQSINVEKYLDAVTFVTFRLLGFSNVDAYVRTFPQRYQKLLDNGSNYVESYANRYASNKLVCKIMEQTLVPSYVVNAPLYQEAVNELAKMIKDPSVKGLTKVRACEALINATKQPDIVKGQLEINVNHGQTIDELREVTEDLAKMYHKALGEGIEKLENVSSMKIIEVEPV